MNQQTEKATKAKTKEVMDVGPNHWAQQPPPNKFKVQSELTLTKESFKVSKSSERVNTLTIFSSARSRQKVSRVSNFNS